MDARTSLFPELIVGAKNWFSIKDAGPPNFNINKCGLKVSKDMSSTHKGKK